MSENVYHFKFSIPDDESLGKYISIKGEKGEKGDPTKLSELENDTGFVTKSTTELENYYTKSQTDTALGNKVDNSTLEAIAIPDSFFTDDETVTGSGTSIELDNTAEAVLKDIKLYGNTQQDGTPTPTVPVDIETVAGEQTITIRNEDNSQSQVFTLSLGDLELCKLGNYQDYIYKSGGKWYLHKEVDYATVDSLSDGSSYSIDTSSTNTTRVLINQCLNGQAIYVPTEARAAAKCNHFIFMTNWNTDAVGFFTDTNSALTKNGLCFRANKETIGTSATEVEEWLNDNPLKIYYVLANATDTLITDPTLLAQLVAIQRSKCYDGTTLIGANGTLAAFLYVEAFKNGWSGTVAGLNAGLDNANSAVLSQKPYYLDSVADMKAYDLMAGDMVITTGYYSYNDGGAGKYKILDSDFTADNGSVIDLANGLQAILIVENDTVNVKQFGAKGDGSTDDSVAIQNALAFNGNNKSVVEFVGGATYIAKDKIYIYSNTDVKLNGSTIKTADDASTSTSVNNLRFMNNLASMTSTGYGALENFTMQGGTLDGNTTGVMFCLFHAQNCRFENIELSNCFVATHVFDLGGCKDITIKDCNFTGCLLNVETNNFREVIQPDHATYNALPYWGNDPSFAFDDIPTDGLTVDSCTFKKNDSDTYYLNAVGTHAIHSTPVNNIVVKNCTFYGCEYSNIRLPRATNVLIDNNTFYGTRDDRTGDNFAINFVALTSSSLPIVPSENITISNNKYISTLEQDDQIFIGIYGYGNDNPAQNVKIIDNEYNGVAVSEADYIGQDFSHIAKVSGVVFRENHIKKAKHCLFKTASTNLDGLKFTDNTLENCLRTIRGGGSASTDATNYPESLLVEDNLVVNPLGSINTSSVRIVLGLADDVTLSGSSATTTILPLAVQDGLDLYFDSTPAFAIPSYIRKFKISGYLNVQTTGDGILNWTRISAWDRSLSVAEHTDINHYLTTSSNTSKTVSIGEYYCEDKGLSFYFNSATNRLWRDGRFTCSVRVNTASDVTIKASNTKIIIEGY